MPKYLVASGLPPYYVKQNFFIVPRKNLFRAWRTKSCDAAISKKGEKTKANALGNAFAYVRCFDVRFGNARAVRHGALVVVIFDAYQR